ncbi:MarR family winged helix-turn-helix transcriptional regulator [Pediococcus sp. M21F004]|uniref:MarR family winged helix-turn-helix transcriptional regulator n=1 Tax=Pediococcus sp. M21F004 TaxID=3390033 RepID=UPI003DA6F3F1
MPKADEIDTYIRTINTVSHKLKKYVNAQLKDLGLTSSTYFFVLKVGERGQLSQDELFNLIHLNPSNITRGVDRLIKLGYMSKEQSATDARMKMLKLTKLGKQKYHQLVNRLPTINVFLVDSLTANQVNDFKQIMKNMETNLDSLIK